MEESKVIMNPPVKGITLDIQLRHPDAKIPTKAHNTDNGYDLYAVSVEYDEDIDCYVYHTGVSIKVPVGYSLDVIPKSRHRRTHCYMPNTPGDVDPGYTGEILVNYKPRLPRVVINIIDNIHKYLTKHNVNIFGNKGLTHFINGLSLVEEGVAPYGAGEAIAQCYLTPHPDIKFNVVNKLPETERGEGGHGSTEKNNH